MIILLNKNSGGGTALRKWNSIYKKLKLNVSTETFIVGVNGSADKFILDSIKKGETDFIIAGGDGSINYFLNRVLNSVQPDILKQIKIGTVGIGSSNDFHKPFHTDQNVKWADNDGDGRADVQAWSTQPPSWEPGKWATAEAHWMLFLDVEKDGVLGWQEWRTWNFGPSNWDYTGCCDWLPDYNGSGLFLKIHRPPQSLPDTRLNWENPFAFYDYDGDGLTEMAMRWLDPLQPVKDGSASMTGVLNEAFVTFDLETTTPRRATRTTST